jgi:hypothetical protein
MSEYPCTNTHDIFFFAGLLFLHNIRVAGMFDSKTFRKVPTRDSVVDVGVGFLFGEYGSV